MSNCINQLSNPITDAWDNQFTKRKYLFWNIVLKVPVHYWVDPLLLGIWQGSTSRQESQQSKTTYCIARKQEKRGGAGVPLSPLRPVSTMTWRPPPRPHLLKISSLPSYASLWDKPLLYGIWGDIADPKCSSN